MAPADSQTAWKGYPSPPRLRCRPIPGDPWFLALAQTHLDDPQSWSPLAARHRCSLVHSRICTQCSGGPRHPSTFPEDSLWELSKGLQGAGKGQQPAARQEQQQASLELGAPAEQKPATLGPGISAQRLGILRSGMRQSPHPWPQRAPQVPKTMAPRAQLPQCCPGHGSVHFSSTVTHVLLCDVPLVPSSPGLWAPTWGQEAAAESKVGGRNLTVNGSAGTTLGLAGSRHGGSVDWGLL